MAQEIVCDICKSYSETPLKKVESEKYNYYRKLCFMCIRNLKDAIQRALLIR